jgi:hypothetical protein
MAAACAAAKQGIRMRLVVVGVAFYQLVACAAADSSGRHTTLWLNHLIPSNIEYAVAHADALTRVIPAYKCWQILDNGTHTPPTCGPDTMSSIQEKGIELWPEVSVSKNSMLSGTWKPALSPNGTLGATMRKWGWHGVVIDFEEVNDTPQCRKQRCGSSKPNCSACIDAVSGEQYTHFLAEFATALKAHGLRMQITVGKSGPAPLFNRQDRLNFAKMSHYKNLTAAMQPVAGKFAVLYPFNFGGNDKQMQALISYYKGAGTIQHLNLVFGGEFQELVQNGTRGMVNTSNLTQCPQRGSAPPCPNINYHWREADYSSTLQWLASSGACEITLYPGPGGNLPAGAPLPRNKPGVVAEPGRLWTTYIAPWMIDGLRAFKESPGGSSCK